MLCNLFCCFRGKTTGQNYFKNTSIFLSTHHVLDSLDLHENKQNCAVTCIVAGISSRPDARTSFNLLKTIDVTLCQSLNLVLGNKEIVSVFTRSKFRQKIIVKGQVSVLLASRVEINPDLQFRSSCLVKIT